MSDRSQKTIFITSLHGLVSRVLECGLLEHLSARGLRIIIFCPDFKKLYFEKIFKKYPSVVIEGISQDILPRRAFFFQRLTFPLLHTTTMHLFRRSSRDFTSWPRYFIHQGTASVFGRFRFIRVIFRAINYYFSGPPVLEKYFKKYNPALVISMDIRHILDTQFVIEAKKCGIKTVGMVRSWDYLTGKGIIRVQPHVVVVHNKQIKKEAMEYADIPSERIEVVGMPHFDPYVNYACTPREKFFEKINLPPDKRLLLFAPMGDKFNTTDGEILEIIQEALHSGALPGDIAVLVRLPPGDTLSNAGAFKPCKHFSFDYPGVSFSDMHRKANEMSFEDILHLADTLYYSSAAIVSYSTICIDGAVFDVPLIFRNFDGYSNRPYYEGTRNHIDYNHVQLIVRTHPESIATSPEELILFTNRALEEPAWNRAARKRIVEEQCADLDGKASKRLAQVIKEELS